MHDWWQCSLCEGWVNTGAGWWNSETVSETCRDDDDDKSDNSDDDDTFALTSRQKELERRKMQETILAAAEGFSLHTLSYHILAFFAFNLQSSKQSEITLQNCTSYHYLPFPTSTTADLICYYCFIAPSVSVLYHVSCYSANDSWLVMLWMWFDAGVREPQWSKRPGTWMGGAADQERCQHSSTASQ